MERRNPLLAVDNQLRPITSIWIHFSSRDENLGKWQTREDGMDKSDLMLI
jgi:hypothetical protein